MVATFKHPLLHTPTFKGLFSFFNQESYYVSRQNKIKEIIMYKFKTTAAEMQEIRIVMAFYFYTRFTHR
jgi:hypothetical protein